MRLTSSALAFGLGLALFASPASAQDAKPAAPAAATAPAAAAAPAADPAKMTPEELGQHTAELVRRGDWAGFAALLHADALKGLKGVFAPLTKVPDAQPMLSSFFGVETAEAYDALSDAEVFSRMFTFISQQEPMSEAFSTMEIEVIGSVPEGEDVRHVVSRTAFTMEGARVTQMEVSSFKRENGRWWGLLKGDMQQLMERVAASLQQMADAQAAAAEMEALEAEMDESDGASETDAAEAPEPPQR